MSTLTMAAAAAPMMLGGDIDWKERALRWEKEAQRLNEEAARLKGEVEDWKAKFETLLEASLQQINRLPDDTRSPSSPHSNGEDAHEKELKKIPIKNRRFFVSFSHILGNEEKGKKKERKDTNKDKEKIGDKDKDKKGSSSDLYALDEPSDFSPSLSPSTAYQHLPRLQVCHVSSKHRTIVLTGPEGEKGETSYQDFVAAKAVSTYPFIPGNPIRDGDPIADRFSVQLFENRLIACVADGCNWGEKVKEAACKATSAFVEYVNNNHEAIVDVKKAGVVLLNGFEYAHNAIMDGKEAFWEAGTTTLLGGVLLEINKGTDKWTPQWEFVCCSVGDCKAFCYANGEISDITQGNRMNVSDPRDCGGRLGPHLDEGKPDLRNLNLFCASCEEGDIIFIVTDGVHDNLDPQHLGKLPKDMPKEFNLHGDKWDDVDQSKATFAKNQSVTQLLQKLLDGATNPKEITERLVDHCIKVTKKSREYMESNGGKRIPDDYVEFPGKMDHTTCLCFRVGRNTLPQIPSPVSSPSSSPTSLSTSASNTPPTPKDNWTKISPTLKH